MNKTASIYIAGHSGLVGSAVMRTLQAYGYSRLISKSSKELDLTDQAATNRFFESEKPEYVVLAAAKVGGIHANSTYPADFIRINLQIQTNVIAAAHQNGVKKLIFLGSSCIYPKHAPQPMKEEHLLTGPLEPTNEAYAIAKIAGVSMCKSYNRQYGTDYIALMPTNLYGPNDNFELETSHVLPAMLRKFHEAKLKNAPEVTLWGSGSPKREFLHVDDLAKAAVYIMENYSVKAQDPDSLLINVGTGEDVSIKELAEQIKRTVGYEGNITWDSSMPDGTPKKLLDVGKIHGLGWKAGISLAEGIKKTYEWYKEQRNINHRM